jgi:hypothetical protein
MMESSDNHPMAERNHPISSFAGREQNHPTINRRNAGIDRSWRYWNRQLIVNRFAVIVKSESSDLR